jgi:hypothetical protein
MVGLKKSYLPGTRLSRPRVLHYPGMRGRRAEVAENHRLPVAMLPFLLF